MVAIDYDDTYTRDPWFWQAVILMGQQNGHRFVCVTFNDSVGPADVMGIPVVHCVGVGYKRDFARKAGFLPDVWIDDMPQLIAPEGILQFDGDDA